MKKVWIVIIIIIMVFISVAVWHKNLKNQQATMNTTQTLSPTAEKVFHQLPKWFPTSSWSSPQATTQTTYYGKITGIATSTTITTKDATVPHFGQSIFFRDLGFDADKNLDADGAGSSVWGYKKGTGNDMQIITFTSRTKPTSTAANEPLQFNCPCQTTLTVFVSGK